MTAEETQRQLAELAHYLLEMCPAESSVLLEFTEDDEVEAWLRTEESMRTSRADA